MSPWIVNLKKLYEELGIKINPSTSLWDDPQLVNLGGEGSSKIGSENSLQTLVIDLSIDCIHIDIDIHI